ncbi:MAG: IS3 family transposase [Wolbachia sp.]|uniref:IS3 family transposase n=1 Tax=unclassified Wolbachia TaxID=2640676 RepID=UPI00209FD4CB|nr:MULTISPECIES: IS3 family transposase [unclassified Wolbachia]
MNVSVSGYYKWAARKISSRELANKSRYSKKASKCRYGAPKIHAELKALGKSCNLKTVQSIMRKNGMRAMLRRKFKTKKQQTDNRIVVPNILDQNFIVDQPNKVWATDITYIRTKEGWLYLVYSRMIVNE